jgi:hypothetical protein
LRSHWRCDTFDETQEDRMRDLVYRYLEGGLSRRGFLNGMARAGFTAAAAKTALAPLAAAGAAATVDRQRTQ